MSGEKTEQPTQKKLDDAKEKGQVAASKDAQLLAKLLAGFALFFYGADFIMDEFSKLIDVIAVAGLGQPGSWSNSVTAAALELTLVTLIPMVAVTALAATLANWAQTGLVVAPEAAQLSFKKFDVVGNIKNMFSKKSLIQLLLSLCKVSVLATVGTLTFLDAVSDVVYSYRAGFESLGIIMMHTLKTTIFMSLGIFVLLVLLDWVAERAHHIKQLKMSKQDIKDENKQTQGDPAVKNRRRSEHRSILNSSLGNVGKSKVVVANPTHISVALDYEPGVHDIPYVLAMGEDDDALIIRKKAKELGIPVIVNVELARMIYADCEEYEYIHREHLELAAVVFKTVMQLAQEKTAETEETRQRS
ncbi:MAG: EscU/YscU/HrcU family type III secretion system export apparatus switch protein [Limnobacter sp.]|nr:EscU/YscU/HrcU family type III secretion system export apparatus switch protein [Limnobacter sp.]